MPGKRVIRTTALLLFLVSVSSAGAASEIDQFESLIKAGQFAEAKEQLEVYTTAQPGSWKALYQLGFVEFRLHLIQPSINALCRSIVLNGSFADSHRILAYNLNMLRHPELAQRELTLAIQFDPSSAESHYELGRIDYEQGSYRDAAAEFEKAKALAPGFLHVYHNLGLAYAALSNRSQAVENFEQGLRLNEHQEKPSAWPFIDYATFLNTERDFARSRDMALRAIQIDNSWSQAFEELSKAYRGLNQTADAVKALQQAIYLDPHKAELHYVLSRLYAQSGRPAEAKAELTAYQRAQKTGAE